MSNHVKCTGIITEMSTYKVQRFIPGLSIFVDSPFSLTIKLKKYPTVDEYRNLIQAFENGIEVLIKNKKT